jgi:hypothetical protein
VAEKFDVDKGRLELYDETLRTQIEAHRAMAAAEKARELANFELAAKYERDLALRTAQSEEYTAECARSEKHLELFRADVKLCQAHRARVEALYERIAVALEGAAWAGKTPIPYALPPSERASKADGYYEPDCKVTP